MWMAPRRANIVILAEDLQHVCFVRRLLEASNFDVQPRKVRVEKSPPGRGSAEQYVREQYPKEIAAYRSKAPHMRELCLVVMTDADIMSVAQRRNTLNPAPQSGERIAVLIPKRNIETWLHHLRGHAVNEAEVYPRQNLPSQCDEEAKAMVGMCRAGTDMPSSMAAACTELKRLTQD
jgi:hypothetical protein